MKKALLVGFTLGMLAACSRPESRNLTTRAPTPSSPMADAYDQVGLGFSFILSLIPPEFFTSVQICPATLL
jgi:hypothetical protein